MGQYGYLTNLLDKLELGNNIHFDHSRLGGQLWAFNLQEKNSERIKSITYMEAIVHAFNMGAMARSCYKKYLDYLDLKLARN